MSMDGFGFGEGVAVGIHVNNLRSSGSSVDYVARRRIRELTEENEKLEKENLKLREMVSSLTNSSNEHYTKSVDNARLASAGFIVMTGMIRAMDNLSPELREKFRSEVVSYSDNRISIIDESYKNNVKFKGIDALLIRDVFSKQPEYSALKFGK